MKIAAFFQNLVDVWWRDFLGSFLTHLDAREQSSCQCLERLTRFHTSHWINEFKLNFPPSPSNLSTALNSTQRSSAFNKSTQFSTYFSLIGAASLKYKIAKLSRCQTAQFYSARHSIDKQASREKNRWKLQRLVKCLKFISLRSAMIFRIFRVLQNEINVLMSMSRMMWE